MKSTPRNIRSILGCGYEPPGARVEAWEPPPSNGTVGFDGDPLKTCPGYTTRLPEVNETLAARMHWEKGELELFDRAPHENLLSAVLFLDGNVSQFERWKMTPSKDGGGAD